MQDECFAIELPQMTDKPTEELHLCGNSGLPSRDILVPCCGEPLKIILNTMRAVCVIDYPQTAFHVLALDNGNSIKL